MIPTNAKLTITPETRLLQRLIDSDERLLYEVAYLASGCETLGEFSALLRSTIAYEMTHECQKPFFGFQQTHIHEGFIEQSLRRVQWHILAQHYQFWITVEWVNPYFPGYTPPYR